MRVISNINKCASRGCNNTPVIVRCLGFNTHLEYDGRCNIHQYKAGLVDHRDYLLQSKLNLKSSNTNCKE